MIAPVISLSILSFLLALFVTPRVAALAERFDLLDKPSARKVHSIAIPRIGGLAIFLAFSLSLFVSLFFDGIRTQLLANDEIVYLFAGGLLAFLLGFYDDIKQLGPKVKFAVQIGIAIFAYLGGIKIKLTTLPLLGVIQFGWMDLPITIFWMLLVINAINLIDGLDGLAAGVSFFVCIVLLAVALFHGKVYMVAIALACLSGSLLGFLVFNFNPASIFMGDSGSYFLGYMLATLSIVGSIKSHTAFTFLIPIIAMGVPLLDTVWATVRRFIFGQKLFHPDKDHFHHRLMKKGYSHKRTVAILYAITICLGGLALLTINIRDKFSASFLGILGILIIVFVRKLGYLDFLGLKSFLMWVNDLTNVTGINRDRRVFLAYQLAIAEAENMDTFWERIVASAQHLGLDYIEMQIGGEDANFKKFNDYVWHTLNEDEISDSLYSRHRLYIRFPLKCEHHHYGVLKVSKKHSNSVKDNSQTLWRLEFLRRTLSSTLHEFKQNPKYGLQDRRVPVGDRRIHTVKDELLDALDDRRNHSDRRQRPATAQSVA